MTYAELLSSYIEKSNLSLSQISNALKEKGFSTDKGYISKLQNNKIPPAGEELSRALAEITGGDPDLLNIAAYIEKAPVIIRPLIKWYLENWDTFVTVLSNIFYFTRDNPDDPNTIQFLEMLKTKSLNEQLDIIMHYIERYELYNYNDLRRRLTESNLSEEQINNVISTLENKPVNKITVFDHGKSNWTYDWVDTSKTGIDPMTHSFEIIKDDSMSGANITKGSKVLIRYLNKKEEITFGKIYQVFLNNEFMIRRIYKIDDNTILLQSENPNFPPTVVNKPVSESYFSIIGIVESVEFNPNA
ncbi:LexA family protein [Brevibacillus laterosporus]|uniref:LexA family protein n=1 Tax=Brevibacillus laterosporus TaxID=1465 RepID=UPI00197C0B97|nr:S24 family peptidase [Brevibacillus laterosporus]WNX33197.1 S24 family peptidase [Brevibacillus laterosporus]